MSGERNAPGPYEALASLALAGREKQNRTGINTIGIFGHQMRFNLSYGEFPLITTKKVFTRGIFEELKWFIKGETNIQPLLDKNVHIWDSWATEDGDVGPIYGEIWRRFPTGVPVHLLAEIINSTESKRELQDKLCELINDPQYQPIDQLRDLVKNLREKPYSRRHLVTAWAPTVLPDESISPQENVKQGRQCLAACHTFWQVYVEDLRQMEAFNYRNRNYRHILSCLDRDITQCNDAIDLIVNAPEEEQEALAASLRTHRFRRDELTAKHVEALKEYELFNTKVSAGDYSMVPTKRLSMQLYQRSADIPLGVPFNIASYAALLQLLAVKCDMIAGDFIHTLGDAHVYMDQVELLKDQIERDSKQAPALLIEGIGHAADWSDVDDYKFEVIGYDSHPAIKFPGAAV